MALTKGVPSALKKTVAETLNSPRAASVIIVQAYTNKKSHRVMQSTVCLIIY